MTYRQTLNRRQLFRLAGAAGAVALSRVTEAAASEGGDSEHAAAMLYDATRCVGCRSCEAACKEWNNLPADQEEPVDTTAYTWTLIKQYQALLLTDGIGLTFTNEALREIAECADKVNKQMENIGARRLHTIMTTLLENILFEDPHGEGVKKIRITKKMVQNELKDIISDENLSRYIL